MSSKSHYPYETELLARAIFRDDPTAIDDVLSYLGSSNANLRQIMQACLHDVPDQLIWTQMLYAIASAGWEKLPVLNPPVSKLVVRLHHHRQGEAGKELASHPVDIERLEQSIVEAFTTDQDEAERGVKDTILNQALHITDTRYAAAYLLAQRNEVGVIPLLEEMICLQPVKKEKSLEQVPGVWSIRAIHALAALQDERCGAPLVRTLAMDRGVLHKEAQHAISELGRLAVPALLEALHHTNAHIRWHAARFLNGLGITDVENAPDILDTLAAGLYDDTQAVRWATARALAQLDAAAVPAILRTLIRHPLTEPFRQAVHYTLHSMQGQTTRARLKELIDMLHQPGGNLEAPAIAQRLLSNW